MTRVLVGSQSQSYLSNMGSGSHCAESLPTIGAMGSSPRTSGNVSIGSDRPGPPPRKIPLKQTSFQIPRVASGPVDAESILGGRTYEAGPKVPKREAPKRGSSIYRAAERGRGELLPTSSHGPNRARSSSSTDSMWSRAPVNRTESRSLSLRSRGRRTSLEEIVSSPSMDLSSHKSPQTWSYSSSHDKPPLRGSKGADGYPIVKNTSFMQMLAVLVLTCLVYESYHRAISTTEQFEKLKHNESVMMLHLQRLVQHNIHLHEDLGRLNDGAVVAKDKPTTRKDSEPIDAKLIHVQTQQLYQMEEELSHELRGLQAKLQHVARGSIAGAFGEGPFQVSFDLDLGGKKDGTERISISLWNDTPYTAWTLMDQVQRGLWTGSTFKFDKGLSLTATPPNPDDSMKLDFVEKSQKNHEAWTVGLSESDGGGLNLFVNLQDNSSYRKHDVCIGKIVEGFGSLQKLVDSTRRSEGTGRLVTIEAATVSRLEDDGKKKGQALFR